MVHKSFIHVTKRTLISSNIILFTWSDPASPSKHHVSPPLISCLHSWNPLKGIHQNNNIHSDKRDWYMLSEIYMQEKERKKSTVPIRGMSRWPQSFRHSCEPPSHHPCISFYRFRLLQARASYILPLFHEFINLEYRFQLHLGAAIRHHPPTLRS